MLKKILAGTSVLAIALTMANTANAEAISECNGIYLGIRAGANDPKLSDGLAEINDDLDIGGDNTLMLSGAIGYRYDYFRIEAEYIWRDTNEDSQTLFNPFLGLQKNSAEFDQTSYMLNGYWDLSPTTWFTPYFSAGVGFTELEYSFNYQGQGSDSYKETNFTWSLGGGISAKMTNRLNLDIGYRYFDMDEIEDTKVTSHEIYFGARYVF